MLGVSPRGSPTLPSGLEDHHELLLGPGQADAYPLLGVVAQGTDRQFVEHVFQLGLVKPADALPFLGRDLALGDEGDCAGTVAARDRQQTKDVALSQPPAAGQSTPDSTFREQASEEWIGLVGAVRLTPHPK